MCVSYLRLCSGILCVDSWAPRRKTSAGGDFYDTPETKTHAFAADWVMASTRQQLPKKIQRAADKLETPDPSASDRCYEALVPYAEVILQTFTFYSSLGSGNDIVSITRNSYLQFVRDLALVRNEEMGQRDQDLQLIFESANASATKDDIFNHSKSLNRSEWVGCLVQLILARYVLPQLVPVGEAVTRYIHMGKDSKETITLDRSLTESFSANLNKSGRVEMGKDLFKESK